jgi:hypothetical protein
MSTPAVRGSIPNRRAASRRLNRSTYTARRIAYQGRIRSGNSLMSVHAVDGKEVTGAKEVFKNGGADDISLTLVKQLLPRSPSEKLPFRLI